jgi:hypothetical protein
MSANDNIRLFNQAQVNTRQANTRLAEIQAVPPGVAVQAVEFTVVKRNLTQALAAVTELERLALGGEPPVRG